MRPITLVLLALLLLPLIAVAYERRIAIEQATLNVTVSGDVSAEKAAAIVDWVTATARSIEAVYGQFPVPRADVFVSSKRERFWAKNDAVQFGQVTRKNGGTIELFVNAKRPIEEFYADWTATHEFSHLMLPLLDRSDRWISEGFATYYQNILMARSGAYDDEKAWTRLLQGFERGRQSRPSLSPHDATANRSRGATMKIYWSGASIALMADIEVRRQSNGRQSLDTVLGELQNCCLPARYKWSGVELFRRLDTFLETPVFMPLYDRYANEPGYPDPKPLLEQLGVRLDGAQLVFSDTAELASIRKSLTVLRSL